MLCSGQMSTLCSAKLEHYCFKTKQSTHSCHFQSWCFPTHKLILFTYRKKKQTTLSLQTMQHLSQQHLLQRDSHIAKG